MKKRGVGTFLGHQWVPQMAISGDFLVATDKQGKVLGCEPLRHPGEQWQLLGENYGANRRTLSKERM